MITQSDPGTENFGIANTQTMFRQMHDPTLSGFVQQRWMRSKKNIIPEIAWSQLRHRFTPGFKALLDDGVKEGLYDPYNTLQKMLFRWLFIPWLQQELDSYVYRVNNTRKRHDKNKVLPHGIPELIHRCAADYGALDFKVTITPDAIDHVRQLYINPNHPVFDLVPASLGNFIEFCYDNLGCPPIHHSSIWMIYGRLLDLLQQCQGMPAILVELDNCVAGNNEDLPLIEGLEDLHEKEGYFGGVANGLGLQQEHLRELDRFLDEEPDHDEEDIDEDNNIDAGPSVWVECFTSDEGDSAEEVEVDGEL
ncbi:hypothetical protein JVT61DRAFT_7179 [Boletus reticuloceps]|uniref:Uncharacterized protein n=1 Tax=Boletus reticuloceps TaxID=495285 RepID=A0A8I2YJ17_9AGAM|nr:hypothetical protein JVT61DRAFT_7179 [Boletus reticuloceps]